MTPLPLSTSSSPNTRNNTTSGVGRMFPPPMLAARSPNGTLFFVARHFNAGATRTQEIPLRAISSPGIHRRNDAIPAETKAIRVSTSTACLPLHPAGHAPVRGLDTLPAHRCVSDELL